ncbi:hypothetical protein Pint_32189 [Pistacia integerrima]|uniref:Uncharacterized protein n=1 Tax=Pistacia integerrima TaxID=434235 RepID=A0ACC0XTT6_9ROSI|nr:hypothetical protein Pint_32189 [Pistacia integerrima]
MGLLNEPIRVAAEKHRTLDILIQTSGENRLSNFLLWQSSNCLPIFPSRTVARDWFVALGLGSIKLPKFQRCHSYLEKKKKQL